MVGVLCCDTCPNSALIDRGKKRCENFLTSPTFLPHLSCPHITSTTNTPLPTSPTSKIATSTLPRPHNTPDNTLHPSPSTPPPTTGHRPPAPNCPSSALSPPHIPSHKQGGSKQAAVAQGTSRAGHPHSPRTSTARRRAARRPAFLCRCVQVQY